MPGLRDIWLAIGDERPASYGGSFDTATTLAAQITIPAAGSTFADYARRRGPTKISALGGVYIKRRIFTTSQNGVNDAYTAPNLATNNSDLA